MADSNDTETEEKLSCIRMKLYHPHHADWKVFQNIDCSTKKQHKTHEVLQFGRHSSCSYVLSDPRVSRWQFALQPFQHFNSSAISFEIKNLRLRTDLYVNNMALAHLNKTELPSKCTVHFGDYQFFMEQETGESVEKFEICFEITLTPPSQEVSVAPTLQPIPEHGIMNPTQNSSLPLSQEETAEENDENEL